VLPVSGTREGLFAFAQTIVDRTERPLVLMPNPFYQIYEGAAFLAGAEPIFLTLWKKRLLPELDAVPDKVWQRCQLLYICTPGNPTGAVMDQAYLGRVLDLADRYDFIVASDECYAEIYLDEAKPPPGLLQVCEESGRHDFKRCVVFHSLSKRSSLPGLRSGFVAGDARVLENSCSTAPTTVARCRCPCKLQACAPGTTSATWSITAACTSRNSKPPWKSSGRFWICTARRQPLPLAQDTD